MTGDLLGRAAPSRARSASSGLTGSAIETCATQPGPKKLFSRAKVRSMNWSTMTKCPGGSSSFSDPQAEIDTRSVTPARFSASMLARKLIADGGTLWPRPWRGRKRTGSPSSSANRIWSDGSPHGEVDRLPVHVLAGPGCRRGRCRRRCRARDLVMRFPSLPQSACSSMRSDPPLSNAVGAMRAIAHDDGTCDRHCMAQTEESVMIYE